MDGRCLGESKWSPSRYLLVSTTFTAPARALYCSSAPARFKQDLLERLVR